MSGRNQNNNYSNNFSPQIFPYYPNYYERNIYQQYPVYYNNDNIFYSQTKNRHSEAFQNKNNVTNQNNQYREFHTGDNKARYQKVYSNQIQKSRDFTNAENNCRKTYLNDVYTGRNSNGFNNEIKFTNANSVCKETFKTHTYNARHNIEFRNNNFSEFSAGSEIRKAYSNEVYMNRHNKNNITHAVDKGGASYHAGRSKYDLCNEEQFSNVGSDKKETDTDSNDTDIEPILDAPKKRTISKITLMQKVTFPLTDNEKINEKKKEASYTDEYWQKQKHSDNCNDQPSPKKIQPQKKVNKIEKMLNEMLSAPVEMSKGKSLLEKMGWQGGGLGKDGAGIVEPIAPKGTYATSTMGLGQLNRKKKNAKKKSVKKEEMELKPLERLYVNTLLCLFDFVKNDREIEVLFDKTLTKNERKRVHLLVEELRNCNTKVEYSSLVDEINEHNHYVLYTVSEGEGHDRQLLVYKEAPEYVYLITPDDLTYDDDEETEKKSVLDIIVNYFFEYIENDEYTEFRFLGPFEFDEKVNIDTFFAVCRGECNIPQSEKILKLFKNQDYCLEMEPDSNGKIVIHKSEKRTDVLEQNTQVSDNGVHEIL